MRNHNRRRLTKIPDVILGIGLILLLTPVIMSARMSILQSQEAAEVEPPAPVAAPEPVAPVLEPAEPEAKAEPAPPPRPQKPSIVIPKLNLDATIVEEVTEADLDRGPMRLKGTGRPGSGNCCIAGHREKWFRGLRKLAVGDEVILRTPGNDYVYSVTGHKTVKADNVLVLGNTSVPTVTLITCSDPAYLRRGEGRLVVKAELKAVR